MMKLKNDLAQSLVGYNSKNKDTLLSKIALATLGCVVGYDKNVKASLRSLGYAKTFSKKGLQILLDFAKAYKMEIQLFQIFGRNIQLYRQFIRMQIMILNMIMKIFQQVL